MTTITQRKNLFEIELASYEKLSICSLDYEGKYTIMHEIPTLLHTSKTAAAAAVQSFVFTRWRNIANTMTWDVCQERREYASCNSNFPAQSWVKRSLRYNARIYLCLNRIKEILLHHYTNKIKKNLNFALTWFPWPLA